MTTPDIQGSHGVPVGEETCDELMALLRHVADAIDLALDLEPIESSALLAEVRSELDDEIAG